MNNQIYYIKEEIKNLNSYVLNGDSYLHLDTLEHITCEEYDAMLAKAFNNKEEAIRYLCLSIIEEKSKLLIIDNEIERLKKLKNNKKRKIENITNMIRNNCNSNIDFEVFQLFFRKGVDSVEITDESIIPNKYKKEVITYQINKNEIKKDLKNNNLINGATLVTGKKSVIIK